MADLHRLLPLGALAAGFGLGLNAHAQTAAAPEATLAPIPVKAAAETDKDSLRATTTTLGKGQQALRDVPQSVTVVTERLIDDRNLDTLKDALRSTAGITFQAAEGSEEDIRLRGFSLQATGDIFLDGLRDPGFYERDSFNWERLELLRGSASMLFGRGSTGGAVNQVDKQPLLLNRNEVSVTLGSGDYVRATGDFNLKTGEDAALRINTMLTTADRWGNGLDKQGIAPTFRWGIGTADEFSAGLYHLQYRNGVNYGLPWLQGRTSEAFDAKAYYGAASDYNAGSTTNGTLSHTHRFSSSSELKSTLRIARYERDMRASAIRFCGPGPNADLCPGQTTPAAELTGIGPSTILTRGSNNKIQDMDSVLLQSDYSQRVRWGGREHALLAGIDLAIDRFQRYAAVLPGGPLRKPTTTVGTPDDGGSFDESLRDVRRSQRFDATALGLYAQDLVQLTPTWKALAGLRWDRFSADYDQYATANLGDSNTVAPGTRIAALGRTDSLWSKRLGLLWQPSDEQSYHLSYGTSFNTFGDTYSFDAKGANTPPESSRNVELGGSIDWADGRFTTRFAIFHATKYNERNTDEDSVSPDNYILSGQRHAAGIDLDFAGRLTAAWEVFASVEFIPDAKVDKGTLAGGETVGARPALTPRRSGALWTTYRLSPTWRVGGGLTARSSQRPVLSQIEAPGFVTADLMAEYTTGPLVLKLNVANLADRFYADQLYRGHYIPGKPRTVELTGTLTF